MAEYAVRHQFELVDIITTTEADELLGVANLLKKMRSTDIDAVLIAGPAVQARRLLDKVDSSIGVLTLGQGPQPPVHTPD